MQEMQAIGKDRRNREQGYSFRGLEDIYNELHGLLAKHGVFTVPRVVSMKTERFESKKGAQVHRVLLEVEYHVYAKDGSSVVARTAGEGMDWGDKATNKAMSAAHKYAFIQLFAIHTEDLEDGDYEDPPQRARDSSDNAHRERQRERDDEGDPWDKATSRFTRTTEEQRNVESLRADLGKLLMKKAEDDKDRARQMLKWLVGRESLKNLTDFEAQLAHLALRTIDGCGGDAKKAKDLVSETWKLPWFDRMTELDYKMALQHVNSGGVDLKTVTAEGEPPF